MDIDRVPRQVIDSKLLAALDDDDKVAMILSEADLMFLIKTLEWSNLKMFDDDEREKLNDLLEAMVRLGQEAFG